MSGTTKAWRLTLAWIVMAVVASAPLYQHPDYFSTAYDWRYFLSWIEVGRRTLVWWGQAPLWNPYVCGGMPHLANPQSIVASPTFVFALAFGTALGAKLMLTFYLFAAFDGMHRLARREGLAPAGAITAAMLFGAGGWLAIRLASGHINFAGAALFPYLALAYRRAQTEGEWTIVMGAIATWIVALGGTSTPAMASVLLVSYASIDAVRTRRLRPFVVLGVAAVVAALLGAARFLPALEFAIDHPRRQWETDANSLWQILKSGWWWRGVEPVAGKRYWFHEYGYRMPYLCVPLLLWAPFVKSTRRYWIVAAVGAAIAAGSAIPFGPWWMLKHLPIFRDLRVPSRYLVLLAFAFPILCGGVVDDLRARLAKASSARVATSVVATLIAVMTIDGLLYDWARFRNLFDAPISLPPEGSKFFHVQGHWSQMMPLILQNRGVIGCDEEARLERALKLDLEDVPLVKLETPASGAQLERFEWTPNRVTASVTLVEPATLLVNGNWNEHWKTSVGEVVRFGPKVAMDSDGGRLGVKLPSGHHDVVITYRPTSFVVGAWVSGAALPLAVCVWTVLRRRRRVTN